MACTMSNGKSTFWIKGSFGSIGINYDFEGVAPSIMVIKKSTDL
jgi:hypothetical protein